MESAHMPSSFSPAPELLARHSAALRALARTLLGNADDADDVVQETWLALVEAPPRRLEGLGGWLATVLRRRASNRRRESARRSARERARAAPEAVEPRDLQQHEETLHAVVAAVSSLAEPLKTVVLLRYFEDLPPR